MDDYCDWVLMQHSHCVSSVVASVTVALVSAAVAADDDDDDDNVNDFIRGIV